MSAAAVWMRARASLRARAREIVVLSLVAGVLGGAVLLSLAGARQTSSSFDRLLAATDAHDVEVSIVDDAPPETLERVGRLPMVERAARAAVLPADDPSTPFRWNLSVAAVIDEEMMRTINRPLVHDGRLFDPAAPAEAVVSREFAAAGRVRVGDDVSFSVLTFPEMFEFFGGQQIRPSLAPFRVRVVGIVQLPHDVKLGVESSTNRGLLYLSPAFYARHAERIAHLDLIDVKLRRGMSDFDSFVNAARRLSANPASLSFTSVEQLRGAADRALGVQAAALILFGVLAAAAGIVIVGQSIARTIAVGADDAHILSALGMTRPERVMVALIPGVAVAMASSLIAAAAAVAASPLMPLGVAREIDPALGFRLDAPVVGIGAAAFAVVLILRALRPAIGSARSGAATDAAIDLRSKPAAAGEIVARAGMPPSLSTGVRFATDARAGRMTVPIRGALMGTFAGSLAIVAALTFGHSLATATDDPRAYGFSWDGETAGSEDPEYLARALVDLRSDAALATVTRVHISSVTLRGREVKVFGFQDVKGTSAPVIVRGVAPGAPDEIVAGRRTMRLLDATVGSSVSLPREDDACAAAPCASTYRIVGEAVLPALDDNDLGHGIAGTLEGVEPVAGTTGYVSHLVRFAHTADARATAASLERRHGAFNFPEPPSDIVNLGRVEGYPYALAALLGVVALASVAHALVTSVSRRRRELAILKVLGFVRRQTSAVVAAQASTLLLVALAVGVPFGIVVGRWSWTLAAERASLAAAPATPVLLVAAVCAAALVAANGIAALPARAAARTSAAAVLRSE